MAQILTGEIGLHRERQDFSAGFCFIHSSLASLTERLGLLHPTEIAYYQDLRHDLRRASYLGGRIAAKLAIGGLASRADGGISSGQRLAGGQMGPGMAGFGDADFGGDAVGGDAIGEDAGGRLASIAIGFGVFQFPVVKYYPGGAAANRVGPVQVGISHCDDIAVALAFPEEHPLGIDLERAGRANADTIKSYVTPGESVLIARRGIDRDIGFTIFWTMKEALTKILRTGLMVDLSLLEIDSIEIAPDALTYTATFRHLGQFKAMARCEGNYVCSVALPRETTPSLDSFWRSFSAVAGG